MGSRQAAHRKKKSNRLSMILITTVVLMITIAVAVKCAELKSKIDVYAATEAQLESQIAAQEQRSLDLEEYEKYTHTKKYIEDVAKDRLGLVYEGEIIFKEAD